MGWVTQIATYYQAQKIQAYRKIPPGKPGLEISATGFGIVQSARAGSKLPSRRLHVSGVVLLRTAPPLGT